LALDQTAEILLKATQQKANLAQQLLYSNMLNLSAEGCAVKTKCPVVSHHFMLLHCFISSSFNFHISELAARSEHACDLQHPESRLSRFEAMLWAIGMDIIPKSPPSALISESGNIAMIASSPVSTSDESCARISCPSFAPNQWNLKLFTLPKPITLKKMLRNPEKTFWTR